MRVSTLLAITLNLAGILAIATPPTQAIQTADGTVSFEKPPRLVNVITTYNSANVWGATYYFTLTLPENAGETLQQVTISQRQGVEDIRFRLEDTVAFEGTPNRKGEGLTLQAVTRNDETDVISVIFDPPVPPGKTFTVGLKPRRNPSFGGVYLFGVTAFPAGEKPYGLYLGVGRLHFYRHGCRFLGC